MNYRIYFKTIAFLAIFTFFVSNFAYGQMALREQKLLNGLKLLVWNEPGADKITVKLRIHSGAAFDPKDKTGVMALLGEILFPGDQSRAFFTEDLGGSLDITTTYDYIQITASGKSDEVLAMLQAFSNAIVNPQITPENFKLVQTARLKKLQELEKNSTYISDRAVAKRLLGEFPYGRSAEGTSESVAKLDFADLIFAKERFFTADNATLAILGNIKPDYALRAVRQLFGGWVKSERRVPATFAMPGEPDLKPQMIGFSPSETNQIGATEIRFATRGFARNEKDYWAIRFLADLLQTRFRTKVSDELKDGVSVVHERTLLPGLITFKFSFRPINGNNPGIALNAINPNDWLKEPVTSAEFDQTRTKILAEIDQKPLVDKLLDIDTFKLVSVKDEIQKLNAVTQADVQRVADKLAKQPFVQVVLNNSVASKP
jgi:predicted Zn-dependent peptidase